MAWRLHLTNRSIQDLYIVGDEPPLLATWHRRDRVAFYNLETGVFLDERTIQPVAVEDRREDEWQQFVAGLTAPNDTYLPVVHTAHETIYISDDGKIRLYFVGGTELFLETDGNELPLDPGDASGFVALALDRFLGLSAALDTDGRLHIFQQHIRVGAFDLDLSLAEDFRPVVAIARGGRSIFVTDNQQIVLIDSDGKVRHRLDAHYVVREMACSPDGDYLVTSDAEIGMIRVYDGADLIPCYQKFAIDLVADATQVQLLADLPPTSVAPGSLAIDHEGRVAFAMSGVICVSDLSHMDELPRLTEQL